MYVQTAINIILGLVLPIFIGVSDVYNLTGTWFTFALAIVYTAANIGLPVFYKKEHPDEFSIVKHVVVPAAGSLALIAVVYASVNPLPDYPISLAPFIVVIWLLVGVVVQAIVYRGARASLLGRAGQAMGDSGVEDGESYSDSSSSTVGR